MAQLETHQPSMIYRGTVDEVFSHRNEIPPGATLELKVFEEVPQATPPENRRRPSVLGKYAFVAGGSEEFARQKQAEIAREDRPR